VLIGVLKQLDHRGPAEPPVTDIGEWKRAGDKVLRRCGRWTYAA
jgi:hypothetical protein